MILSLLGVTRFAVFARDTTHHHFQPFSLLLIIPHVKYLFSLFSYVFCQYVWPVEGKEFFLDVNSTNIY